MTEVITNSEYTEQEASVNLGAGWSFFSIGIEGSTSRSEEKTEATSTYTDFSMSVDMATVTFVRDWFKPYLLYSMPDIFISALNKGDISSGDPYGKNAGTGPLYPT